MKTDSLDEKKKYNFQQPTEREEKSVKNNKQVLKIEQKRGTS